MLKRFPLLLCYFFLFTTGHLFAQSPQNGRYKEYFSDGSIKVSGYYKNGLKIKTWLYYQEGGKLVTKEKWKNGEINWKVKYEEGKVSEIIDKEGNVKVYSKCGC